MQLILGPAVQRARHDTEQIFHGKRDSGPVMSLHTRHRNHDVRGQGGFGQVDLFEAGEVGDRADIIAGQSGKARVEFRNAIAISCLLGEKHGVAAVAGPFADLYLQCPEPLAQFHSSR